MMGYAFPYERTFTHGLPDDLSHKPIYVKRVICFGGGYVFSDFMERYGKDFDVEAVIDNSASRW